MVSVLNSKRSAFDQTGFSHSVGHTRDDILRWRLASNAVRNHLIEVKDGAQYINLCKDSSSLTFLMNHQVNLLVDRAHNWPATMISFTKFRFRNIPILVAFNIAGFLYGALHLLAWYAPFKTSAEMILWQFSGLYLVASGPFFASVFTYLYMEQFITWCLRQLGRILGDSSASFGGNQGREKAPSSLVVSVETSLLFFKGYALYMIATCFLVYLAARTYLVVECYVNLFHLDKATYAVPKWSQYFPHIN
jgi:CDP-diglyceride synthetase